MCRKCQKPRPVESHSSVDTRYYENIFWKCKGTERYAQNYAISGSVWNCPECREKFDWIQTHYELEEPPSEEDVEVIQPWCGGMAANSNPFAKRPKGKKRGGAENRKNVVQSGEPSHEPAADAGNRGTRMRDTASDDSDSPDRKKERRVSSVQGHKLGLICMIAVGQVGYAEGVVDGTTTATVTLLVASTTAGMFVIRRSVDAVDVVIEAVENKTVEFVSAIGDEGIKFIPIVFGIVCVLLIVFLRQVTNRYWWSKKEMLKGTGQNPEANVNVDVE